MNSRNDKIQSNATHPTLIRGLQASKEIAWNQFYDTYASMIVNFACKRGCSSTQAEDVLQETVLSVMKVLPKFDLHNKKGKFRSLLFKITESKIIDAYRRNRRNIIVEDPAIIAKHQGVENYENENHRQVWDKTWENFLLSESIKIVISKVQSLTYRCFELTFIKGKKVKDVAVELEISPNLVAQHKHKVYNLIIKEAEKLKDES